MSVQEYIERDYLDNLIEVDDNIDEEENDENDYEVRQEPTDDDDLSKTNFNAEADIEPLVEEHSPEPRVTIRPIRGVNHPAVKVTAVHKKTGERKIMTLYLKDRALATEVNDDDRLNVKTRLAKLQEAYPNFVIYSY
jgi:hypothetical protein